MHKQTTRRSHFVSIGHSSVNTLRMAKIRSDSHAGQYAGTTARDKSWRWMLLYLALS